MAEVSKRIRQLRIERGLTQTQLAERLNVTRQTVSSWERDMSHPDINTLQEMASIFGISIEELIYARPARKVKRGEYSEALSGKFIFFSAVIYFALLVWGGVYIGIPLFRALLGGNMQAEIIYVVLWGLLLLVIFIAICTCLISEYCAAINIEPSGQCDNDFKKVNDNLNK